MSARRVLISGGASGFGRALGLACARRGWRVAFGDIHAARAAQTLAELEARLPDALNLVLDVRHLDHWTAARDALQQRWGGLDLLINNAGVAAVGEIDAGNLDHWERLIDVNLMGVVRGCHVLVPLLRGQSGAGIINIASSAALLCPPALGAYNVTKAGVVALSETLRVELEPHGIGVTVACPGFFRTHLTESMSGDRPQLREFVNQLMDRSSLDADDVAEAILEGARRGRLVVATHALERRLWRLKRLAPALYLRLVHRRFAALAQRIARG